MEAIIINNAEIIWVKCKSKGFTDAGCAAVVGSADYESGLNPKALENSHQRRIGLGNDEYTKRVDNGTYSNFSGDTAGYGLFQWTWHTRKAGLYQLAKERKTSIGDIETQIEFFFREIETAHGNLKNILSQSDSVQTTSRAMTTGYECPADTSENAIQKRAEYAQTYYNRYAGKQIEEDKGAVGVNVSVKQIKGILVYLGYNPGEVENTTDRTYTDSVSQFQKDNGLTVDGIAGPMTIASLKDAVVNDRFADGSEHPATQENTSDFWGKYPNFSRNEFKCTCGGKYCNGFPYEMEEKLIRNAQAMRDYFKKPVHVSSGVRCKKRNAEVGGVATSRHQYGKAMDFFIEGVTANQILGWTTKNSEISYSYAIDGSYVHMDIL